jgi:hypothetical protein
VSNLLETAQFTGFWTLFEEDSATSGLLKNFTGFREAIQSCTASPKLCVFRWRSSRVCVCVWEPVTYPELMIVLCPVCVCVCVCLVQLP